MVAMNNHNPKDGCDCLYCELNAYLQSAFIAWCNRYRIVPGTKLNIKLVPPEPETKSEAT